MNKDSNARPGHSLCDFCGRRATQFNGTLLVCDTHANGQGEKRASATVPLKSAALAVENNHRVQDA